VADQIGKIGYPNSSCNKSGHLTVEEHPYHQIYWEEYGLADGEPVVLMQGAIRGTTIEPPELPDCVEKLCV
jgi:hypothetical protein